jgi:hypothetical protein
MAANILIQRTVISGNGSVTKQTVSYVITFQHM